VAVVVDANLLVVIVSGDARGPMASAQIGAWITANQEIHAPELLPYEVASALTRLVAGHAISSHQARSAWETLEILPIVQHPLSDDLPRVVDIALRLKRQSAYDAAYIALAQELGAILWTLDRPLARNAQSAGLPVRLLD
jgi:predicted nucleic acid-binding protein